MADRWCTFDCYGTLVDWNGGIAAELERVWGPASRDRLLTRYHEVEPLVEAEAYRSYRDVLAETLARLAVEEGLALPDEERGALGDSLPRWSPFPEVPDALAELRRRGVRLAILSNSDRDLIAASIERLAVPFDHVVVAEDVQSYKPAHGHWERFFADTGAERDRHVHVGASLFHDIAPANELGLVSVWINRLGETADEARPTRELPDLSALPDTVDELVAR
ncbi:MAG: 2-haloacid dehalogenase [Gaiellaceae bacterium]|nr:2-haloacid dehalogenase [Gaiellaceae bacterium]